jgi:hypothetical protein
MPTKVFFLTLLLALSISFPALAIELTLDDQFFMDGYYGDNSSFMGAQGYCIHNYDRFFESNIYQCQHIRKVYYAASTPEDIQPVSSFTSLRFSCWRVMHNADTFYSTSYQPVNPLILGQSYEFSLTKPTNYDFSKPCKLKVVSPDSQTCNIDSKQIIQTAFAQKFPLDLFIGIQGFSSSSTCPQFTIRNQTFQLCYLTKLVKSLKYVLLLVFIISSLIAL